MMRNFVEMFLRVRQALEFSHGQDPKRTRAGRFCCDARPKLQHFKTLAECNEARLARGADREKRAITMWDTGDRQAGTMYCRMNCF
jgi:hypothetical protein